MKELVFRPRERTTFRSALADQELHCPGCRGRLVLEASRWPCAEHGVFVEHAAFAEMYEELTREVWQPPWLSNEGGAGRPCPACEATMTVDALGGCAVERCAAHGIWFDGATLEEVLTNLARPARGWFARLFR
jgi:hypothetical protein